MISRAAKGQWEALLPLLRGVSPPTAPQGLDFHWLWSQFDFGVTGVS